MRKFFIMVLLTSTTYSNNLSKIAQVLKQVESLGFTGAVGDNGKAFGILQIHKVYVDEVNQRFGTTYEHSDMFDERCAEEVFLLYMEYATKRFKRKYGVFPTEQDIVRMHNGGMYQGHIIHATVKYYKRYLKFKD